MTSYQEAFITLDGISLWTARQGSGPPLVLLHGGPGMWDCFDELAAMVDDLVEVARYDQRGCGRSQPAPPYTVEAFIADLDALRRFWGYDHWTVCGHSAGATLALAYAVEHPRRVDTIICISGGGVIDAWSAAYHAEHYHTNREARWTPAQRERYAELRALLNESPEIATEEMEREFTTLHWIPDVFDPSRAFALARQVLRPHPPGNEVNAAMNADWRRWQADGRFAARLAGLETPALIVHGAADPRPRLLAERLVGILPGARLVVAPDAGHWPWLENPGPVREALRTFLRDQPTPRPPPSQGGGACTDRCFQC
jgi:proline iminopeptidase